MRTVKSSEKREIAHLNAHNALWWSGSSFDTGNYKYYNEGHKQKVPNQHAISGMLPRKDTSFYVLTGPGHHLTNSLSDVHV